MELHDLKSNPGARKKRKRVGRGPGSGQGKTAGKGHKGAKARAGYSRRLGFEGGQTPLHRRLPKRGFNHANRSPFAIINLDVLEAAFETGADVTTEAIIAAGLAKSARGGVKVLGRGEITKKLNVKVQAISPGAQEKVIAAGGTVELIDTVAPVADAGQAQAE
jgi:large subunit ribosomal protein L15